MRIPPMLDRAYCKSTNKWQDQSSKNKINVYQFKQIKILGTGRDNP